MKKKKVTDNIIPFPPQRLANFQVAIGRFGQAQQFSSKVCEAFAEGNIRNHLCYLANQNGAQPVAPAVTQFKQTSKMWQWPDGSLMVLADNGEWML